MARADRAGRSVERLERRPTVVGHLEIRQQEHHRATERATHNVQRRCDVRPAPHGPAGQNLTHDPHGVGAAFRGRNVRFDAIGEDQQTDFVVVPDGREREHRQHLVSLVSVEDDATGEELEVVWEIEPGTQVIERAELPAIAADRLDDPAELDAFLDAVRWGAVTSADQRSLQAPFRSGITIEDYQLEPLVRALRMPRTTLLIADDVGLGKTIEAGLVVQELLLRHRARTALVVCPASLQVQWRDEMREKFGLEFRIVDRELLGQLRRSRGVGANPFAHFPRLIVSIDWLKGELGMRLLREVLPPHPEIPRRYDVLIVDEVHNCAPGRRRRPLRARHAAHAGDPDAGAALRAPAVPVGDAAQRL